MKTSTPQWFSFSDSSSLMSTMSRNPDSVESATQTYSGWQSAQRRVIVIPDSDFGTLAIFQGEPLVGIVYVWPGHIDPQFTISTLRTLFETSLEIQPPFLIVARRSGQNVSIGIRQLKANE